ncbi:hypothetical protein SLA2020_425470 [Shorea laevis]
MDLVESQGVSVSELFQVQSHLYKHIFGFVDSMSVNCAIQLGIPDIIHNHGQPLTLPQLVSKLHIHPTKLASSTGSCAYWCSPASSLKQKFMKMKKKKRMV